MLNASIRNSVLKLPNLVFLIIDMSTLKSPGPRTLLRPVLPKVAVVSAVCWKQDALNHASIVALLATGSHRVFGRLFVRPVDSICCCCVMVTGRPERAYRMPLS